MQGEEINFDLEDKIDKYGVLEINDTLIKEAGGLKKLLNILKTEKYKRSNNLFR